MRKRWSVILSTILVIVACLCMSACSSSKDVEETKDPVDVEQEEPEVSDEPFATIEDIDDYEWDSSQDDDGDSSAEDTGDAGEASTTGNDTMEATSSSDDSEE